VSSHDAFGYLAARYGLHEIAVTGLDPEAEARPRQLRRVIDQVRRSRATTVFVEPLLSRRLAETVARDADVRIAVLDPIENASGDDDYFTLMRANLRALREALGCR
jgi:zinc transport system substrate-binding protein